LLRAIDGACRPQVKDGHMWSENETILSACDITERMGGYSRLVITFLRHGEDLGGAENVRA